MDDEIVDVIIPVFNNFADAQRLLDHIRCASNRCRCRILVIDDASPDPWELKLPSAGASSIVEVELVRSKANRGFAGSVNIGLGLSRRDVVLLNTDTLVFDGWLDRLKQAAYSREQVATVTPLSNAATILSYPTSPEEYKGTLEIDWRTVDEICAQIDAKPIEIPTGVGFCMFVRRGAVDAVGDFDDQAFKDGYGEECDFCRRAAASGWLNLVAPNVFVWHRGEGSFKARARDLRERAQRTLGERHPDYHRLVRRFIQRDPLRDVRQSVDLARLAKDKRPRRLHLRSAPSSTQDGHLDLFLERRGWAERAFRPTQDLVLPNLPAFTIFAAVNNLASLLDKLHINEIIKYSLSAGMPLTSWRLWRAASRSSTTRAIKLT